MKYLLVLYFWGLILQPIIFVHGNGSERTAGGNVSTSNGETFFKETRQKLDEMAKKGRQINGVLQLKPGPHSATGYLGEGGYGLVYQGIRLSDSKPVAIKFINTSEEESAKREYAIYTYLHAIDNPKVERFGIPVIYWYGHWEKFIVMALTLCDGNLLEDGNGYDWSIPLNNLIVFRQFVRQSKYIHSCGVRHDDIKPENLMLKNHQCFLIDYNLASTFSEDTELCTYKYMPKRCHREEKRLAIDDWESFLYAMCNLYGVPLKWFSEEYVNADQYKMDSDYYQAKKDVKDIVDKIKAIESIPMRNVFMAFSFLTLNEKQPFPNYDKMDEVITAEIDSVLGTNKTNEPVFFTWMDQNDIEIALKDIRKVHSIPNIQTDIKDPRKFDFSYPTVDFNHFDNKTKSQCTKCKISTIKKMMPKN